MKLTLAKTVGLILGLSLVLGCEWAGTRAEDAPEAAGRGQVALQGSRGPAGAIEPSPFVAVAEWVTPGVVSIDTKRSVSGGYSFEFGEPFGRIFRDLIPDLPERQERRVPNFASGFIFDKRGYVLTNHHVVRDADDIVVRLLDENEYKAEIVGADPNTDIAVLRIDFNGEPPVVNLGDSDSIRVGDWAIAIGNPFGRLEGTMTVGVISAKGRSALNIVGGTPALQDFIQTDASINFGNSGGPLVNIRGEAIGMNTAINALGQGIGFAIPINLAKHVASEIIERGRVSWGYLGVYPQEITRDLADAMNVEPKSGILVGSVIEDGPAARAGLKTGDIIVEFSGQRVSNVDQFRLRVAEMGVGKEVPLVVLRDGDRKTIRVKLGERPGEVAAVTPERAAQDWLGLEVDDVSGREGRQVAPADAEAGVVVVGVEPGSPADDAGMVRGDVIEEVNGEGVRSLSDYRQEIGKAEPKREKPVLFLIRRQGTNSFVAVKPRQN